MVPHFKKVSKCLNFNVYKTIKVNKAMSALPLPELRKFDFTYFKLMDFHYDQISQEVKVSL